jgi:hypothetical protein
MAEKKESVATSTKKTVKNAPEKEANETAPDYGALGYMNPHPEYVEVTIPKDRQYGNEAYYVCVNGRKYGIPRDGKPHKVPYAVAQIIKESREQDAIAEDYMDGIAISE